MLPFMKNKEAGSQEPAEHQMREPDEGQEPGSGADGICGIHSQVRRKSVDHHQ